jgi:CheY-like chemotaxis protein
VRLTKEAFKEINLKSTFFTVEDGIEALSFLHKTGRYTDVPRPDLILLDLNIPIKNGFEVLDEIKKDFELKRIPVVILTTSESEEDIKRTYNLYANCYITKPLDLDSFVNVARAIESFWFNLVRLPAI